MAKEGDNFSKEREYNWKIGELGIGTLQHGDKVMKMSKLQRLLWLPY